MSTEGFHLEEEEASNTRGSRLENMRAEFRRILSVRTSNEERPSAPRIPKTPLLTLGLGNLTSTNINIPHLIRTAPPSIRSISPTSLTTTISPAEPSPTRSNAQNIELPQSLTPTTLPQPRPDDVEDGNAGHEREEQTFANRARLWRRWTKRRTSGSEQSLAEVKRRRMRTLVLNCFVAVLFLVLILSIYLALALSKRVQNQEFAVLLILMLLIATVFFGHSLVRLCMAIVRPSILEDAEDGSLPPMSGPSGFANPPQPIRVALARDEEAAGIESQASKRPPPAYGLWRESVRVDPNWIFWQRNEAAQLSTQHSRGGGGGDGDERPVTANRPPSYISDDGIDYVVEAAPRSTAPTTDVPLPPHPSEIGRLAPALPGHNSR